MPLNFADAQEKVSRAQIFKMKDLDESGSLDADEFSGGAVGKMRTNIDVEFERKDSDDHKHSNKKRFDPVEKEHMAEVPTQCDYTDQRDGVGDRNSSEDGTITHGLPSATNKFLLLVVRIGYAKAVFGSTYS